jgi:hypothetical protein
LRLDASGREESRDACNGFGLVFIGLVGTGWAGDPARGNQGKVRACRIPGQKNAVRKDPK